MIETLLLNIIKEYSPSIVVFDVMYPRPVLNEIARSTKTILIMRATKSWYLEQLTKHRDHQALDGILIAEYEIDFWRGVSDSVRREFETANLTFLGPVGRYADASEDEFSEVAKRYGLSKSDRFILISCGGGGILNSASEFVKRSTDAAKRVAERLDLKIILVTGPNFKPLPVIENVAVVSYEPALPLLMSYASAVVTHVGPNSLRELQASGTPGLLVPMDRPNESQTGRASYLKEFNVVDVLASVDEYSDKLERTLSQPRRAPIRFPGAANAAEKLASLLEPNLMLIFSSVMHVKGVRAATFEEFQALLIKHPEATSILIDDEYMIEICRAEKTFPQLRNRLFVLNIGVNRNIQDIVWRAERALAELALANVEPSRIVITFEELATCGLAEVAKALAKVTFAVLIIRTTRTAPSEIYDMFYSCYFISANFRIDVTSANNPVLDCVFWN